MYSVLNTLSEYKYSCISKNITSNTSYTSYTNKSQDTMKTYFCYRHKVVLDYAFQ